MDLLVKARNRIFYQVDSQLAAILCAAFPEAFAPAGDAATPRLSATLPASQAVNSKIPYAATPTFGIGKNASGYSHIQLNVGREVICFDGKPENASATFARRGYELPDDVLEAYRRVYQPRFTTDEASALYADLMKPTKE